MIAVEYRHSTLRDLRVVLTARPSTDARLATGIEVDGEGAGADAAVLAVDLPPLRADWKHLSASTTTR